MCYVSIQLSCSAQKHILFVIIVVFLAFTMNTDMLV